MDKKIERFQENLALIRSSAGLSAAEFGKKVGVTKQTINSLERKNSGYKLQETLYYAMRYVLDEEIKNSPNGSLIKGVIDITVDHADGTDGYTEAEKKELLSKANVLASSMLSTEDEKTKEVASSMWIDIVTGLVTAAASVGVSVALAALSKSYSSKTNMKKK